MQLDLAKGTVVKRWNFDTCCGGGEVAADKENARLTAMLNSMPDGAVVVFGIQDEGVIHGAPVGPMLRFHHHRQSEYR